MKKIFLLIAFLFPFIINAQPFIDIISANYQYNLSNEPLSKNKLPLTTNVFNIAINLPLKVDSDYIVVNPSYENQFLNFDDSINNLALHSLALPLTWLHQWKNQKWKTAFVFVSRLNGDMTPVNGHDFQFGGAILNVFKKNENLKYKFGLYYNSEFFGPFFMPLLGIDWNVNSRLNIFGVLPGSMNLEYKLVPNKFHTGINFRAITSSYRLQDSRFLKINDNQLRLFADYYVTRNNVLSIEAGHTILRKYKTGIRLGGKTSYDNLSISESYLFKIAYAYRIRTDK